MTDEIKHVHARVPMDIYLDGIEELDGKSMQSFIVSQLKKLIRKGKKKKKDKKKRKR